MFTFVLRFMCDGESVSNTTFKQKVMLEKNVVLVSTHVAACHVRSLMSYNVLSVRRSGVPQFCVLSKQVFREYITDMPTSRSTLSHGREVWVHRGMLQHVNGFIIRWWILLLLLLLLPPPQPPPLLLLIKVLLVKLIVIQQVKNFAFEGIWSFDTMFATTLS